MLRFVLALALAALLAWPAPDRAAAQSQPSDVIGAQIEAFQADDFATAFTFAAPGIKRMFQTPENFGRMVQQGYPMVWRPAEVRYGTTKERGTALVQQVFVTDGSGRQFTLEYTMVPAGDSWQIAGVTILRAAEVGA
ncbi:MAG: DUF4864 domain-containing protein [Pseudomonadota bacterium]